MVPVPPLPADVVAVRGCPAQMLFTSGLRVIGGAVGWATTFQLTWFEAEVLQPVPSAVRRLCIMFVPTTAAKFGTLVDHVLQLFPLSVE